MSHHIVPIKTYVAIFLALLVGTALTVWVAFHHLGDPWNDVAALAIACTKATLVVLFFMHVKYSTRLTSMVVVAAVLWFLMLVGLTLTDFLSRGWLGVV